MAQSFFKCGNDHHFQMFHPANIVEIIIIKKTIANYYARLLYWPRQTYR